MPIARAPSMSNWTRAGVPTSSPWSVRPPARLPPTTTLPSGRAWNWWSSSTPSSAPRCAACARPRPTRAQGEVFTASERILQVMDGVTGQYARL